MPIVISTNLFLQNSAFVYGNSGVSPLSVSYSELIPNLNGNPSTILSDQNGALANGAEVMVDFGTDRENVGIVVSIKNASKQPTRGLFRVAARGSTGGTELAYFLLDKEVSTGLLLWVGGFAIFTLQNLSQVTVAAYLAVAPNTPLIGPPL